ncbi:MAG: cytochrome P450, partial [Bradyrhizobium guangdongense]
MSDLASYDGDPFAREFLADPYPAYETLRALGPVFRIERYDVWAMARYAEVESALKDWRTFISGEGVGLNGMNPALPKPLTLQIDPPDHDKGRRVLGRTLSPGIARKLRETFQKEAETKVSELLDKGSFDAMRDLAEAYPMKVFPDAIGIRPDGREKLLAWSTFVFNSFGPDNEQLGATREAGLAAQSWIMECCARHALQPDSLGMMIYQAADEGEITEQEATHLVRPFLTAGVDTTVNGIGNAVLALATH